MDPVFVYVMVIYFCLGSWFRDGTTDTTRTVHFGVPTKHQKVSYATSATVNRLIFRLCFHSSVVEHDKIAKLVMHYGTFGLENCPFLKTELLLVFQLIVINI